MDFNENKNGINEKNRHQFVLINISQNHTRIHYIEKEIKPYELYPRLAF